MQVARVLVTKSGIASIRGSVESLLQMVKAALSQFAKDQFRDVLYVSADSVRRICGANKIKSNANLMGNLTVAPIDNPRQLRSLDE